MPYNSLKELPDGVRDNLPHHAQEIYKEAFNSASDEYKEEATAHKVAWNAVKTKYKKDDNDNWVKKQRQKNLTIMDLLFFEKISQLGFNYFFEGTHSM